MHRIPICVRRAAAALCVGSPGGSRWQQAGVGVALDDDMMIYMMISPTRRTLRNMSCCCISKSNGPMAIVLDSHWPKRKYHAACPQRRENKGRGLMMMRRRTLLLRQNKLRGQLSLHHQYLQTCHGPPTRCRFQAKSPLSPELRGG